MSNSQYKYRKTILISILAALGPLGSQMLQFGPFLGQILQNVNSFGGLDRKYSTTLETRASYYQTRTKRLFLHNQIWDQSQSVSIKTYYPPHAIANALQRWGRHKLPIFYWELEVKRSNPSDFV